MLGTQKDILYIDEDVMTLYRVTLAGKPSVKSVASFAYTKSNFEKALKACLQQSKKVIRILLSDHFVYTISMKLSVGKNGINRSSVRKAAQEVIPENLMQTAWDFKESLIIPGDDKTEEECVVQVAAIVSGIFQMLKSVLGPMSVVVESIEPVSGSLTRVINNTEKTYLVLFTSKNTSVFLVHKGMVVVTHTYLTGCGNMTIERFITHLKSNYNLIPEVIISCGNKLPFDFKLLAAARRVLATKSIHPAVGLALKRNLKGRDEQVLNLTLDNNFDRNVGSESMVKAKEENEEDKDNTLLEEKKASSSKSVVEICVIIILLSLLAGFYFYQNSNKKKEPATQVDVNSTVVQPTSVPTTTIAPNLTPGSGSDTDVSSGSSSIN